MMPVKKDASGRRTVEAEVDLQGTPEQVWQAIATGPGISSWFVPSTVEQRVGGKATANFGPGMDAVATITAWDPPKRFVMEGQDEPNAPVVATEWTVESKGGGTCKVRVVHSWFASSDDWDTQFEGHEQGWNAFFRILRLYVEHFGGQPSAGFQVLPMTTASVQEAWRTLTGSLGIAGGAQKGLRVKTTGGVTLGGVVESAGTAEHPELLLRLDEPAPGIAHMFAMSMGGMVCVSVRAFFYGANAAETAAREEQKWQAWINQHFPAANPSNVGA